MPFSEVHPVPIKIQVNADPFYPGFKDIFNRFFEGFILFLGK